MIEPSTSPAGAEQRQTGCVLGLRLDLTTYDGAVARLESMARSGNVAAVAAANTHLAAESAADPAFATVMQSFDMVLPDGMPLIWVLRHDGCSITDRVYGPYFMQRALEHSPATLRHFFFGGTDECLEKLQQKAVELNPQLQIAGVLSPPFGAWNEEVTTRMIDAINAAKPDVVWVALGGVKQETWIAKHRHLFQRGVFCAVGDAFVLVAGMRAYAPAWMQRAGLTWLFRLIQEPRRLLTRYVRYNSRFVVALITERLRGSGTASR